jgi:hypothetical protein
MKAVHGGHLPLVVTVPFCESIETNNVSSDIGVIAVYVCVSVMQKHVVVLPKQRAAADPVLENTVLPRLNRL